MIGRKSPKPIPCLCYNGMTVPTLGNSLRLLSCRRTPFSIIRFPSSLSSPHIYYIPKNLSSKNGTQPKWMDSATPSPRMLWVSLSRPLASSTAAKKKKVVLALSLLALWYSGRRLGRLQPRRHNHCFSGVTHSEGNTIRI